MKVNLETAENKKQLTSVRSQIRNSDDLRKFDTFLAKYKVIDFNDASIAAEAKGCCGGENCCQTISPSFHFGVV